MQNIWIFLAVCAAAVSTGSPAGAAVPKGLEPLRFLLGRRPGNPTPSHRTWLGPRGDRTPARRHAFCTNADAIRTSGIGPRTVVVQIQAVTPAALLGPSRWVSLS
jgi:hypothetical protein